MPGSSISSPWLKSPSPTWVLGSLDDGGHPHNKAGGGKGHNYQIYGRDEAYRGVFRGSGQSGGVWGGVGARGSEGRDYYEQSGGAERASADGKACGVVQRG